MSNEIIFEELPNDAPIEKSPISVHYSQCVCFSPSHIVRYVFDTEDGEMIVDVSLNHYQGFWKRLWRGVKYILKIEESYGQFDCFMFDVDEAIDLRDRLDGFIDETLKKKMVKEKIN